MDVFRWHNRFWKQCKENTCKQLWNFHINWKALRFSTKISFGNFAHKVICIINYTPGILFNTVINYVTIIIEEIMALLFIIIIIALFI